MVLVFGSPWLLFIFCCFFIPFIFEENVQSLSKSRERRLRSLHFNSGRMTFFLPPSAGLATFRFYVLRNVSSPLPSVCHRGQEPCGPEMFQHKAKRLIESKVVDCFDAIYVRERWRASMSKGLSLVLRLSFSPRDSVGSIYGCFECWPRGPGIAGRRVAAASHVGRWKSGFGKGAISRCSRRGGVSAAPFIAKPPPPPQAPRWNTGSSSSVRICH